MLFPRLLQLMACAVQLLLSVFFLFVGGMKTFASMPMLELHHAWVAGLPVAIARSVGISELVCGATMMSGLFIRPFAWWSGVAAWSLVANQVVAVGFHAMRSEMAVSGLQNGVLVLALAFIGAWRCFPEKPMLQCSKNRFTDAIDKTEYPF